MMVIVHLHFFFGFEMKLTESYRPTFANIRDLGFFIGVGIDIILAPKAV
jgi:hypothetical protein